MGVSRAKTLNNFKAAGKTSVFNRPAVLCLLLIAAVVIAYVPVRQAGFIWDDDTHITANRA
jgi:hypothetical protein